ncbi:MAG: S8 family serine peptidase, partial [Planctomycetes bacterium]|nr:S8 family serine peptidase [Planctomycetota bacterium]
DIDAPEVWQISHGSPEVTVAVIDSGVDYAHRDLRDNIWINQGEIPGNHQDDDGNGFVDDIYGYDFYNRDGDPQDDFGHGTHCAGIIAAQGNNGLDIAGVCWGAKIMSLKFIGPYGRGPSTEAASAIYYAVFNGADVISCSWGYTMNLPWIESAIEYASSQGVMVVASAGNANSTLPHYPAYYDNIIAVAATNSLDGRASFSTYGSWVEIAAPGVDILSLRGSETPLGTHYDKYTTILSGTSMAAPHVSGAAALLISLNPETTLEEITTALMDSADTIGSDICQSGRLNLHQAALEALSLPSTGRLLLDQQTYPLSCQIEIEVMDFDLVGTGALPITLSSDGGDFETITLLESSITPGIFRGSINLSTDTIIIEDGVLHSSHGQFITATYQDADGGFGIPVTVTDTALVDGKGPEVINITAQPTSRSATIYIETDEPAQVIIKSGLTCGGPYTIQGVSIGYHTSPVVRLLNLITETDYYFEIELVDRAGNKSQFDNDGLCYSFTTDVLSGFYVPGVYPTIQAAIDDTLDGDTVRVANGVYTGEGNRDLDFQGKAITVRSENGARSCLIDVQATPSDEHRGFYFHRDETTDSILDGFTIKNGVFESGGGGIFCEGASPTIRNCIIKNNKAGEIGEALDNKGGGVYNVNSNAAYINCQFIENCAQYGGSMFNQEGAIILIACTFKNNSGMYGGGLYNQNGSVTLTNCMFQNNGCDYGAAIVNAGELTATECIFLQNI